MLDVDDIAKSHQRAPGGAPGSMTGDISHGSARKAEMTLFAFRGAKSPAWTFCDPINVSQGGNQSESASKSGSDWGL